MSREFTKKLLILVDDGLLSPNDALNMCLRAMSEDDVEDMFVAECLDEYEGEDNENDED